MKTKTCIQMSPIIFLIVVTNIVFASEDHFQKSKLLITPSTNSSLNLVNMSGQTIIVPSVVRYVHLRRDGDLAISVLDAYGKSMKACATDDYRVLFRYVQLKAGESIRYPANYPELRQIFCIKSGASVYIQLTYAVRVEVEKVDVLRQIYHSNCIRLDADYHAANAACPLKSAEAKSPIAK